MSPKVDFQVVDHGTIFLLYANTRRAKQWVKHNLPPDHIKYADASVVVVRIFTALCAARG